MENETVYKRIWDLFFKRTCKLNDVILNTCVSTTKDLTTLVLSELEKVSHFFLLLDTLMINFCQVGKNSCLRLGLT